MFLIAGGGWQAVVGGVVRRLSRDKRQSLWEMVEILELDMGFV